MVQTSLGPRTHPEAAGQTGRLDGGLGFDGGGRTDDDGVVIAAAFLRKQRDEGGFERRRVGALQQFPG
jgi:hypothetical protein